MDIEGRLFEHALVKYGTALEDAASLAKELDRSSFRE
jgi:hypothetical protein